MRMPSWWFLVPGLLLVLGALPARAVEVRKVGELSGWTGSTPRWLDGHRWVWSRNDWDRGPKNEPLAINFVVVDIVTQQEKRLRFPLPEFARTHPGLFVSAPGVELLYFDGTRALLEFDHREPQKTVPHYAVWNPQTQEVGPLVPGREMLLGFENGKFRVHSVGFFLGPDPSGEHLYFGDSTFDEEAQDRREGPLTFHLWRFSFPDLKKDWDLDVPLVKRAHPLRVEVYRAFSFDGRKFAVAEYAEHAMERTDKLDPPPQVYVVDLEHRTTAHYPIPVTPYGLAFSRDSRYLAVGSNEDPLIIRIDTEAGRIDQRVKAQSHIQSLVTTASGEYFLSLCSHAGAPRSIEVRRWSDLGLVHTISVSSLFPGVPGFNPEGVRGSWDGKWLVMPPFQPNGFPDSKHAGLVTFAIEDSKASATHDPTSLVSEHIERTGITLYSYHARFAGNSEGYFAPVVSGANGDAFVIGTKNELEDDAKYVPGKQQPYAIWTDKHGKVLWERSLRHGTTFVDYEGGSAVATPDGAFVAFVLCYVHPGDPAVARLVKLDRGGRVVWEWTSPLGVKARFPEQLQLTAGGRIAMTGEVRGGRWLGEVDAVSGRLVRDEVVPPR